MSPTGDRSPYLGGSEGAPPTPPPGGYSAVRRVPAPGQPSPARGAARVRPSVGSVVVLVLVVVFALVLLVLWAGGATSAIYATATLAIQLGLVIAVVAALVSPRGRRLGAIALALVLVVNVGTIGAASAVTRPPTQVQADDPVADHWAAHPGIRGVSTDEILSRTSLEDAVRTGDAVMEAIRARVTERFGYDWVVGVPGTTRNARNGYGGESMLVTYDSDNWATVQPIRGYDEKIALMDAVDAALADFLFSELYPLNDPAGGFDPAFLERLYGSADVRTQSVWEWVSGDYPGPIRVYATITDLTHDDDGTFARTRAGQVGSSGEPIEGLRISVYVPEVLSEADVDEFLERMQDYDF